MCLSRGCVSQQNTKPTHESSKSGERAMVILKKERVKSKKKEKESEEERVKLDKGTRFLGS
jgi:hypothetical protein